MPDRPIVWADQPLDAYLTLPVDRQAAVLDRLQTLAADPYTDASYDPTWHWWTAEFGAGTGFVTFVIARDDHLVVIRLIDAS